MFTNEELAAIQQREFDSTDPDGRPMPIVDGDELNKLCFQGRMANRLYSALAKIWAQPGVQELMPEGLSIEVRALLDHAERAEERTRNEDS